MSILNIKELNILNLGLESFTDSVRMQGVEVVQVKWKPEANGNMRLLEIIDKLKERDEE